MTSRNAQGVKAAVVAAAVIIVALIAVAPTATAAVASTVQHHVQTSATTQRAAAPVTEEAVDAVGTSPLAQVAEREGSQVDYAAASLDEAASSLPGSIFGDAFSPCTDINWLDD